MLSLPGYELSEQIYAGKRSSVFRGRRDGGESVVVKVHTHPFPQAPEIRKFRHELAIGRLFDDERILRYHAILPYEHRLALVVEDFGGTGLDQLTPEGGFDLATFLRIAVQLAEGLGVVHDQEVIHKDVKPGNVVMNPETGVVKLIDFGIASRQREESRRPVAVREIEGSLAYVAPEQTGRVKRTMDSRADFYSLGVTFYELLTGTLPFTASNPLEMVHAHLARQCVAPHEVREEVPVPVSGIVLKLLAKDPDERYQSSRALAADLRRCLAEVERQGRVAEFPLAAEDHVERVRIPRRLYGREEETEALFDAFARAAGVGERDRGGAEMLLISGYPGVGKSALIHQMQEPVAARHGHFVSGRYDRHRKSVPYSAFAATLDELCHQLLTEPVPALAGWKERVLAVLGSDGGLLVDLVPSLDLLLGEQPPAADADPRKTRHRLHLTLCNFLAATSRPEEPLVLFLDDLQWADPASLLLLRDLMTGDEIQGLLLLAAYRSDEMGSAHPLHGTLAEIEQATGAPVPELLLRNLGRDDVAALVADALSCSLDETRSLTELVYEKTRGNAFFTSEFLKSLAGEGLLRYVASDEAWRWDVPEIRAKNVTDNVVELMAARIGRLSAATQNALQLAACFGARFELGRLARAEGSAEEEADRSELLLALWPAVQEGLLISLDDPFGILESWDEEDTEAIECHFKFSHDRVRHAAYSLIPKKERPALHFRIGLLLRGGRAPGELGELLFDVVHQLNRAADLMSGEAEILDLAEINLEAGRRVRATPDSAAAYLRTGLLRLGEWAWQSRYRLTFDLHKELAEACYHASRFEDAEELVALLHEKARQDCDRFDVYAVQLEQLLPQGRFAENIEVGRSALRLLGLELPATESEMSELLAEELAAVPKNLGGRRIADLVDAPPLVGEQEEQLLRLLPSMATAAFFLDRSRLLQWLVARRTNIGLIHGHNELVPLGYVGYGMLAGAAFPGDTAAGREFGKLAVELAERYGDLVVRGRVRHLYAQGIQHWHEPFAACFESFRLAYRDCFESGDLAYAAYALGVSLLYQLIAGKNLEEIREEYERSLPFLERVNPAYLHGVIRPLVGQVLASLFGETKSSATLDDDTFREEEFLATAGRPPISEASFYLARISTLYWLGHPREVLPLLAKLELIERTKVSQAAVPDAFFFAALAVTAVYREAGDDDRRRYDELLSRYQERLESFARRCAVNYRHKHLLVAAESARLAGEVGRATELYREAIEAAREDGFLQHEALSNELYGRFWMDLDDREVAWIYLVRARSLYGQWGAVAKVAELDARHPSLVASAPRAPGESSGVTHLLDLDLATVLKASQAISSEIRLDALQKSITRILVENAGAQRGCVLLEKGDKFFVETASEGPEPGRGGELEGRFSQAVVHYVQRTGEEILLDNASRDEHFANDPYVLTHGVKSVLCMPVFRQHKRTAILYLENNLISRAFTEDRLGLLRSFLTQAAISLENAFLYDDLKREVTEREEAQERLRAHAAELELKNTELEQFTYTVSHDLKSPLVTIQGFLGLLRTDATAGAAERVANDIGHIENAVETMERLLGDLLQLARRGQAVSQPRRVSLGEVVGDVLELLGGAIAERGVEVTVDPALPEIDGDRMRLLEVFQNLIENAARYMGSASAPRIEIGVRRDGDDAVVFVRDNGIGIDPRYHEKVFGLFEQLDPAEEGTGIGLAIVRRIVEVHGGRIWVESEGAGKGSTFCMSFQAPDDT